VDIRFHDPHAIDANCVCSMAYGGHGLGPVRLEVIDINFVRALERDVPFRPQLLPILIGVLEASRLHQSIYFLRRPHPLQRDAFDFRPTVLDDEFGRVVPDPRYFTTVGCRAVLALDPAVRDRDPVAPSRGAGLDLARAAAAEEGVAPGGEECGDQ
jgi:hypothetical protein